jgi:hypothetical protein
MAEAPGRAREAARSILTNRMVWIWAGVWLATRGLIVIDVGFWNHVAQLRLEDVDNYEVWSHHLTASQALPDGPAWQYPPGAAFLMLLPRLGFGSYGESFVALMVLVDLAGLGALALLGRRSGNRVGVWIWLLAMPMLGALPVLRFDLVPAVIGIAALLVIHRRPNWFGALVGLGASLKVWPIALLFGEWERRRLIRSALAAAAALALVFGVAAVAFGDPAAFVSAQSGRGLQQEAVATAPWQLGQLVTGHVAERAARFGAWEIATPAADAVAGALMWLTLAVLAAAVAWWRRRARAIREGRADLAEAAVSRDFVFTLVLLLVVTSRVLSPQYMIWLLGLAAVVLTAGGTRLARPAWLVVGATIITTGALGSSEVTLIRNLALLAATVDASIAMVSVLRRPTAPVPIDRIDDVGQLAGRQAEYDGAAAAALERQL